MTNEEGEKPTKRQPRQPLFISPDGVALVKEMAAKEQRPFSNMGTILLQLGVRAWNKGERP